MADRSTPRTIRGCQACRAAHAKCDTELPSCGRCIFLKCQCIRGLPFPFRHANIPVESSKGNDKGLEPRGEFDFSEDQIWVPAPNNVEFVYENPMTEDQEDDPETQDATIVLDSSTVTTVTLYPQPQTAPCSPTFSPDSPIHQFPRLGRRQPPPLESSLVAEEYPWTPQLSNDSSSPYDLGNSPSVHASGRLYSPDFSARSPQLSISPLSHSKHWPFTDTNEITLLRHFVVKLSLWFDYCDPRNTFATSVIRCAINSPALLYAVLAASARHLSMTQPGHEALTADKYHRKCLSLLIPILNEDVAALDEALFAATVILRLYEEMSVPDAGQDFESHLMGTHTFVRAQAHGPLSAMQLAAFRVVLRQEIVLTFRNQRPIQLLEKYVQVDRSLDQDDDWSLTFHIFVLCAEVLTACYGEGLKTPKRWDELETRLEAWIGSRPPTFDPLIYRAPSGELPDGNVFPEILLLNDCHVGAHTHYLICRILLCAHDPRRQQLGPGRAEAVEATKLMIRDHVRNICGTALSNTHCIPSMFTASAVIAMCGDLFDNYREQKAMYDILVHTHAKLAWPTDTIQTYLRQSWGWG